MQTNINNVKNNNKIKIVPIKFTITALNQHNKKLILVFFL